MNGLYWMTDASGSLLVVVEDDYFFDITNQVWVNCKTVVADFQPAEF